MPFDSRTARLPKQEGTRSRLPDLAYDLSWTWGPGRDVFLRIELVTAPAGTGFAASRFSQRSASE